MKPTRLEAGWLINLHYYWPTRKRIGTRPQAGRSRSSRRLAVGAVAAVVAAGAAISRFHWEDFIKWIPSERFHRIDFIKRILSRRFHRVESSIEQISPSSGFHRIYSIEQVPSNGFIKQIPLSKPHWGDSIKQISSSRFHQADSIEQSPASSRFPHCPVPLYRGHRPVSNAPWLPQRDHFTVTTAPWLPQRDHCTVTIASWASYYDHCALHLNYCIITWPLHCDRCLQDCLRYCSVASTHRLRVEGKVAVSIVAKPQDVVLDGKCAQSWEYGFPSFQLSRERRGPLEKE